MLRYRGLEDDHVESQELHLAVCMDDPQQLAKLLSEDRYKKHIDSRSGWGVPMTPLRLAASNGALECLRTLLANGSEVDSLDVKAQTPLFAAVSAGHLECVRALLRAGANPCGSVYNNCTPVLTAAREGNAQILQELLKYGADSNVRAKMATRATPSCSGPLYLAAVYGHLECFRSLLLHGADPNYNCTDLQVLKTVKHPQTVIEICLKHRCDPEFIKLLIEFGADLHLPDLHAAPLADDTTVKLIEREKGELQVDKKKSRAGSHISSLRTGEEAVQPCKAGGKAGGCPRSLMSKCRVTIRSLLKHTGKLHLIDQLEIPYRLVEYLQHHNS